MSAFTEYFFNFCDVIGAFCLRHPENGFEIATVPNLIELFTKAALRKKNEDETV